MGKYIFLGANQIVKSTPSIDNYLDLITSQHKTQPKFKAWLTSPLSIVDDGIWITDKIPSIHDIDVAVGVQLDTLGQIVGRSRTLNFQPGDGSSPVLNDDYYRKVLKAKIAFNQWDGTIPGIYDIWNIIFPDISMQLVDNQDMTMTVLISGTLGVLDTELINNGYIVPKPTGVGLKIMGLSITVETPFVGILVSEVDTVTVTVSTKKWTDLTYKTWNDIPNGTTWINL